MSAQSSPKQREGWTARWERFEPVKLLLSIGALAAALGSIIALTAKFTSVFGDGTEGSVSALAIQSVRPLTYGEWRGHERAPSEGMPAAQRRIPGRMISYEVDTSGFAHNTVLPVRLILHNASTSRSRAISEDPIRVANGVACGCTDWVPVPKNRQRYYIEIEVYPPGPIRGSPLKNAATDVFTGSGP